MSGAGLDTGFKFRRPTDVGIPVSSLAPGDPSRPRCAPSILALVSWWLIGCVRASIDLAPLTRLRMLEGKGRQRTD
jgi:hypothetical protein